MSVSLTIGPNDEQKKRGEKLVRQGKRTSGLGFLLMLVGVLYFLYKISLAQVELEVSGVALFFGWILVGGGTRDYKKGSKLLEIKFTGELDKMTPYEFEVLLDDLYTKMGYKCENIQSSRDSGADVIAIKDGIKYIIQAKHYNVNNTVGSGTIRDVYGAIKMHDADKAIIVTTSFFTKPAIDSADKMDILLINRDELKKIIIQHYH